MSIAEKIAKLIADGKTDEANELLQKHTDAEVSGLKKKNDELLGKFKSEKEARVKIEERLDGLESDKTKAAEEAAAKSGDVDKIKEQMEARHKKEMDALKGDKEKLNGQLNTHVIGEGLTQALVKANVKPEFIDAATALIKSSFKGEVGDNDGSPFAKFDGKAVSEFVTDWAQTEGGKHFVSADNNSGGGSNGANGSGNASGGGDRKTMTRTEFDALSVVDKSKVSVQGVSLTDE